MKKLRALILLPALVSLAVPSTSFAATKSATLKPVSTHNGQLISHVSIDGGLPNDVSLNSSTINNPNNVLLEDGQLAEMIPQEDGSAVLFVSLEKLNTCSTAHITSATLNMKWMQETFLETGGDSALLAVTATSGPDRIFEIDVNVTTTPSFDIDLAPATKVFGALAATSSGFASTYSGNAPDELTVESTPINLALPTVSEINSDDTMVIFSVGDSAQGQTPASTGYVDSLWLDVTYDDTSCAPEISDESIVPPKTGSVLTIGIISAALLAAVIGSIFGVKRTKLKHRVSERE